MLCTVCCAAGALLDICLVLSVTRCCGCALQVQEDMQQLTEFINACKRLLMLQL